MLPVILHLERTIADKSRMQSNTWGDKDEELSSWRIMRRPCSFVRACFSLGFGGSRLMPSKGKGSITSKMIRERGLRKERVVINQTDVWSCINVRLLTIAVRKQTFDADSHDDDDEATTPTTTKWMRKLAAIGTRASNEVSRVGTIVGMLRSFPPRPQMSASRVRPSVNLTITPHKWGMYHSRRETLNERDR